MTPYLLLLLQPPSLRRLLLGLWLVRLGGARLVSLPVLQVLRNHLLDLLDKKQPRLDPVLLLAEAGHPAPRVHDAGERVELLLLEVAHARLDTGQQLALQRLHPVVLLADLTEVLLELRHDRHNLGMGTGIWANGKTGPLKRTRRPQTAGQ